MSLLSPHSSFCKWYEARVQLYSPARGEPVVRHTDRRVRASGSTGNLEEGTHSSLEKTGLLNARPSAARMVGV